MPKPLTLSKPFPSTDGIGCDAYSLSFPPKRIEFRTAIYLSLVFFQKERV